MTRIQGSDRGRTGRAIAFYHAVPFEQRPSVPEACVIDVRVHIP